MQFDSFSGKSFYCIYNAIVLAGFPAIDMSCFYLYLPWSARTLAGCYKLYTLQIRKASHIYTKLSCGMTIEDPMKRCLSVSFGSSFV